MVITQEPVLLFLGMGFHSLQQSDTGTITIITVYSFTEAEIDTQVDVQHEAHVKAIPKCKQCKYPMMGQAGERLPKE